MSGLRHQLEIAVTWGDCDAAGVVFYPRYYAWFDASTHAMLDAAGLPHRALRADYGVVGLPLLSASARFRAPATYGDRVCARAQVVALGRSTLRVEHRLWVGPRLICEGSELRVWAAPHPEEPRRMRSAPIPEEVRAVLQAGAQLPAPER